MTQRSDTYAPLTPEPAPGLRIQEADGLFRHVPEMAEDIATLPGEGQHAIDYLKRVLAGPIPEEALSFLAYALMPRHAVWWTHECLQALPELLSDLDRQMMTLAAAWVAEPDEDHRYAALDAASATQVRSPGVWLAFGAGWSAGSMSPKGLPEVEVPTYLMGRALNAGVLSSLARVPQEKRRRMLEHYVGIGEVLAKSG